MQTSLRSQLLYRLLPAMLVLLLVGAGMAYWVAWRSATKAYDRALFDTALAIAEQLRLVDDKLQLPLTHQARAVLLTDNYDQIFYAVHDADGRLLDGESGLPLPAATAYVGEPFNRVYYTDRLRGQPVRLAALRAERSGQTVTVLAAETLVKRNALVREIIVGMLLPEFLLILVAASVVWFGVQSGLHPLAELRQELAGRSQADLSPVQVGIPDEIQPVVTEINSLLARLEHSLISQRDFVSNAAHQLRTPIAALQAQVEAAQADPTPTMALNGVLQATRRLSRLVDQLLALAQAEPSLAQTQTEVSLAAIVQQVAEVQLPLAIRKNIDLGFELAPTYVHGNALLLQELLANVLDNALRYTPPGGAVTVGCDRQGKDVRIYVEDSGPGIAQCELERVFERFYRPPGSLCDGSGLGLAIVREIARQHGGSVRAERSGRLGGALVEIRLPSA